MQKFTFKFKSYTTAMHASSLLSEHNIKAAVHRYTDRTEGCMYALDISSEYKQAVRILKNAGITTVLEGEATK